MPTSRIVRDWIDSNKSPVSEDTWYTNWTSECKEGNRIYRAINLIVKEEGMKGYWKGNLPQVIRVLPYSAVQLLAYESYKKFFKGKDDQLSVIGRLAAGACAGMTSTLLTYPLDVLRLRLAVEPGYRTMSQVALSMLRETDEDKEKAQEEEEADEDLEKEQEEEGSQPELQKETEVTEEQNIGEDKDAEQDKNVCNSAEECLTNQSNTKKRRTRGPTRMNKVAKRHEEKVEVEFNRLGEPVGKG